MKASNSTGPGTNIEGEIIGADCSNQAEDNEGKN